MTTPDLDNNNNNNHVCSTTAADASTLPLFYRAANGVTILCPAVGIARSGRKRRGTAKVTSCTPGVTSIYRMFNVCVSARLLLLLRRLLAGLCIPRMSRRSLDTAIRPWLYYCRVPLPSTKTCLARLSTRTSSHARDSPTAPAAGLSRSPTSPAALLSENHVPTAWRRGGGRVFERPTPSR